MTFLKPAFALLTVSSLHIACIPGDLGPPPDGGDTTVGDQAITIPFAGVVGSAPFACNETFTGIGSSGASVQPVDFRLYVHGVTVVDAAGNDVAVVLDANDFQKDGVVLLDFEDGTGACDTGSPDTHKAITGTIPGGTDVAGVRFTLGVPNALNHIDANIAEAPFNIPSLWWSWQGGYKYMKLDVLVGEDENAGYFHHGSTSCAGTPEGGYSCAWGNLTDIALDWTLDDEIAVDFAEIYKPVDLDRERGENEMRGCMAFSGQPDCVGMFAALGMTFEDNGGTPTQSVFSAR